MNLKIRKPLIALSTGLILFGSTGETFAASDLNEGKEIEQVNEETKTYSYEYNGIIFEGTTELTKQELKSMHDGLALKIKNQKSQNPEQSNPLIQSPQVSPIIPKAEDQGNTSVRVISPYYRTYDNSYYRDTADALAAYILTKIPSKLSKSTLFNYMASKLSSWSSGTFSNQYVGSWATRQWSSYSNVYIYHATLVHFTNSSYSTPKKVQYWEINRSSSPNLVY